MATIYFSDEHEYIIVDGDIGTVGISEYAQSQLGDVVFIDLPEVGRHVEQHDDVAVVESVKVASDIYSPVSGEVIEVNETLNDTPALLNEDPMGDGWIFKIRIIDDSEFSNLKDEDDYQDYIDGLS